MVVVHSNMMQKESSQVLDTYLEATLAAAGEDSSSSAALRGMAPKAIGEAIGRSHGGLWDVFYMGTAFSYAAACAAYVELSGFTQ